MIRSILYLTFALVLCAPKLLLAEDLNGGEVYANNCGRCHNFRTPSERNDREWEVAVGHMRSVAGLTGAEERAVIQFLQSKNPREFGKNGGLQPISFANFSGEQIVAASQCQACHVIKGKGGVVGPSLDGVAERRSPDYIMSHINNPRADNPTSAMPSHEFSKPDLQKLLNYLTGKGS